MTLHFGVFKKISLDNRNSFNKCLNNVKGTLISRFGIILFQIKKKFKRIGSIDKFSVSSSRVEMMSLSSGSKRHSLQAVELCKLCRTSPPDLPFFGHAGHADPLDGCHQQLGPHNTKHKHANQSAKHHTTTNIITTVSNTLYNRTSWTTQHTLLSDHLPIITTINIRHDYRLQQNRQTFTNYKKADWTQFTEDTESTFAQTTIPTNIHTANRIFTNIILMADKQNIPKGKMHSNCRLLLEDIVCKITQRNNIRRANTCDPAVKLLNEEITSDIQKHKQNIWK